MAKEIKDKVVKPVVVKDEKKADKKLRPRSKKTKSIKKVKQEKKDKKEKPERKKRILSKRFNKLRIKTKDRKEKGIVYIGHLPKGFNEEELKGFFTQFGVITRIRVSRSSKVSVSASYLCVDS
jgi:nucleolar protein 15